MAGQQDRPSVTETASDDVVQRMERLPPGHPSSPYDEDGTRRPPVARPTDRELPLPDERPADAEPAVPGSHGEGPGQSFSDTQDLTPNEPESPETDGQEAVGQEAVGQETRADEIVRTDEVPGADADHGEALDGDTQDHEASIAEPPVPGPPQPDRRSWWEAVPCFKEQWERHKERWPQEQRPQGDHSNDEPGSWRGDSGRVLSARDNAYADAGCDRLAKSEAQITTRVEDTERASTGELAGKDFRLKERDRLKDKVATELITNADADLYEVVASVRDGVRYTLQYDDADYSSGVQTDVERMKSQGFELIRLKNLWNDAEYKGINSQWRDGDSSQAFEMQFHTSASFEAKQITHKAYERLRNPQTTDEESGELRDYQREVSSEIPIPIGASDIPEYP